MTLELRNPHAILAALRARPEDVQELRTTADGGVWGDLAAEARRAEVTVLSTAAAGPGRAGKGKPGRESAGRALVKERAETAIEQMFAQVAPDSVFLALDQIQDPQNVGAIFRTAAFFGVAGLIMPADRAAPLSGVVYDVASGGVESVLFAREGNLRRALDQARAAGLWILGTSEHAETSLHDVPRDRSWLVVLGNEERGLRRLTQEQCDVICAIPQSAGPAEVPVTSLNVSVSAGIVLAALRR